MKSASICALSLSRVPGVLGIMLSALIAWSPVQAVSKPHSLDDLVRKWDIIDARLSPGGDYLALTVPTKHDEVILGIFPIGNPKDFKTVGVRDPGEMIGRFDWASPTRIVYTINTRIGGSKVAPVPTGELMAINADGSGARILHSWRGAQSTFAYVVDPLVNDDDKILIATTSIHAGADGDYPTVSLLDINSGSRTTVARAPLRNADFLADPKGNVRIAFGVDTQLRSKIYARDARGDDWELIADEAADGYHSLPIALNPAGNAVYVQREEKSGPDGLYLVSLSDKSWTPVIRDESTDAIRYYKTADEMDLYGALFDDGTPAVRTFGASSDAALLEALKKAFPGSVVEIVNFSRDGNYALLKVSASNNPGDFYRFDRRTKKAEFLVARGQWLDLDQLAVKRPVTLKARDGTPLHGYLTLPKGRGVKNLPVVVWVHGGPHMARDTAEYDEEAQIFAYGGYAVLQINFRGSGGYGAAFQTAGYRRWGAEMQDDVTDATRWLVEEGFADPERLCIGGASFGGYSGMMGAVREPTLYRCVISYVGVHDLRMMLTRGDIDDSLYGQSYLRRVLGEDKTELERLSPVTQAGRIKAAVFIAAGGMDRRVPVAHAKVMKNALDKAGNPPKYMVMPLEGHGFNEPESRRDLYVAMLAFLDAHIGGATGGSPGSKSK